MAPRPGCGSVREARTGAGPLRMAGRLERSGPGRPAWVALPALVLAGLLAWLGLRGVEPSAPELLPQPPGAGQPTSDDVPAEEWSDSFPAGPPAQVARTAALPAPNGTGSDAVIAGHVQWADGAGPGEGFHALAWPSERRPSARRLADAVARGADDSVVVAVVAPGGGFELAGLSAGVRYTVTAAGIGALVVDPPEGIVPGGQALELTLSAIYGAAVRLVGEDGKRLVVGDRVGGESTSFGRLEEGLQRLTGAERVPTVALLGDEDLAQDVARFDWVRAVHLLYSHVPREEVWFNLFFSPPGYRQASARLRAPRVRGPLLEHELVLEDLLGAEGRGIVEVRFVGPGVALLADLPRGNQAEAEIFLRPSDGLDDRPIRLHVEVPQGDGARFEGVPAREYVVLLQSGFGNWSLPEAKRRLRVYPRITTPLVIALAGFGSARFDLLDDQGDPYTGAASIKLVQVREGPSAPFRTVSRSFSAAPYAFGPLLPGRYEAIIASVPGRSVRDGMSVDLEVLPERRSEVRMSLADFLEP